MTDQPYVRVPFDYNVSEWNVASRAALCHGRPVKYIFEQALSEMNARSVSGYLPTLAPPLTCFSVRT